jgi:hypothetical protein
MFYVVDRLLDSEGHCSMELGNLMEITYFHGNVLTQIHVIKLCTE